MKFLNLKFLSSFYRFLSSFYRILSTVSGSARHVSGSQEPKKIDPPANWELSAPAPAPKYWKRPLTPDITQPLKVRFGPIFFTIRFLVQNRPNMPNYMKIAPAGLSTLPTVRPCSFFAFCAVQRSLVSVSKRFCMLVSGID